jgi:hypothetical protein
MKLIKDKYPALTTLPINEIFIPLELPKGMVKQVKKLIPLRLCKSLIVNSDEALRQSNIRIKKCKEIEQKILKYKLDCSFLINVNSTPVLCTISPSKKFIWFTIITTVDFNFKFKEPTLSEEIKNIPVSFVEVKFTAPVLDQKDDTSIEAIFIETQIKKYNAIFPDNKLTKIKSVLDCYAFEKNAIYNKNMQFLSQISTYLKMPFYIATQKFPEGEKITINFLPF